MAEALDVPWMVGMALMGDHPRCEGGKGKSSQLGVLLPSWPCLPSQEDSGLLP